MRSYLTDHLTKIGAQLDKPCRYKTKDTKMPWTVAFTKEGQAYFHYHISIVPKGKGGRQKVDKLAFHVSNNAHAAKLSTIITTSEIEVSAKREASILKRCTEKKLPHIVQLLDVVLIAKPIPKQIMYLKYYEHGDLQCALHRLRGNTEKRKTILLDVLNGLVGLHANQIVHLDLKPGNLFLDGMDRAYIGDFGLSAFQNDVVKHKGTPLYMDPAAKIIEGKFNALSHNDIWSFGMIMYELLTNSACDDPWEWLVNATTYQEIKFLHETLKHQLFPKPPKEDVWMYACWEALQLDPVKRPTAQQLFDRLQQK